MHVRNCTISTGDDVIAIKRSAGSVIRSDSWLSNPHVAHMRCCHLCSGKDWSGRQIGMPTANVLVEDCVFKSGEPPAHRPPCSAPEPLADVVLVHALLTGVLLACMLLVGVLCAGHGVSIGSEMSGDVLNITIRNCALQGTERGEEVE